MLNKLMVFLALLAGLYGLHELDKVHAVHKAINATETRLNASYGILLQQSRDRAHKQTEALQANADSTREIKDATIQTLNRKLNVALNELRLRPNRPPASDTPKDSSVVQACTARELYREDAEFLTREATRAESVLVERDYYYQQYEEVRNKLNGTPK